MHIDIENTNDISKFEMISIHCSGIVQQTKNLVYSKVAKKKKKMKINDNLNFNIAIYVLVKDVCIEKTKFNGYRIKK